VKLGIYDVQGRAVRTLVDGSQTPGRYLFRWDGRTGLGERVAAGVYFYRLEAPGVAATRKIVVTR
jgi:flagellar hook assembly protein FlgD